MESGNKQMQIDQLSDERLIEMTFKDSLTKLPNHVLLKDRISIAIANGKRSGSFIAICYLNLVQFNKINERFGTKLGDELLRQIANRLSSKIRTGDTICRYDGDKFIILLMSVKPSFIEKILNRLKSVFEEPYFIEPFEIYVIGRFGICIGKAEDISEEHIIDKAKYAEQHAKLIGSVQHIVELPISSLNGPLGPVMFQGALRGYKDVNITLLMAFISYWIVGLPVGYLLANFTSFQAFGYWIGLISGLAMGAVTLAIRLVRLQRSKEIVRITY